MRSTAGGRMRPAASASASDVCEVMRREKQAWQGRREGAYQERTCPTENAARRSFFARRTLPTLLVEALNAAAETMNRAGRFTPALRSYAFLVLAAVVLAPAAGRSPPRRRAGGTG